MKNETTGKQSDLSFIEYSTLLELEQLVERASYKYSIFQILIDLFILIFLI